MVHVFVYLSFFVSTPSSLGGVYQTRIHGYKNRYSPTTFKYTQEFVLVTFHSLTHRIRTNTTQNITISHV